MDTRKKIANKYKQDTQLMKDLILITGASSGIGEHMAMQLAEKKYDLILAARSLNKLEKLRETLQTRHQVTVHVFEADLSNTENAIKLYEVIREKGLEVSMLVNNAGVGNYGNFTTTPLEEELKMIQLNISSLVVLTKLYAQDMVKRKSGRIMNVASLLSFLPFPYYAVYSATKAFVLAFSETIAAELEGTGVVVTALCPGPVDTPFQNESMMKTNAMIANKPVPVDGVANAGVELLLHGKGKKVVGFNNWFIANLPRITPDSIMMRIKKNLASQKN
jgi:uncharacterized protein